MLTAKRLRKLLEYNPTAGVFHWRASVGKASRGSVAGAVNPRDMHRQIRVDGQLYQAGRLAWLDMTGKWPKHIIACVNRDRSDIRWANLREITNSQKRAFSSTKTKFGAQGVWITKSGKYVAEIKVARQKMYLGSFGTLQEARAAYAKAAKEAFGTFASTQ